MQPRNENSYVGQAREGTADRPLEEDHLHPGAAEDQPEPDLVAEGQNRGPAPAVQGDRVGPGLAGHCARV